MENPTLDNLSKYIALKRSTTVKNVIKTINKNKKHKINKTKQKLIKTQQKLIKSQQELTESYQKLIESHQEITKLRKSHHELMKSRKEQIKSNQQPMKSREELLKSRQKLIKSQKPQQKLIKSQKSQQKLIKSQQKLINKQQKVIKSGKTQQKPIKKQHIILKEKIDGIRKKLNEVHHDLPKSELKEIKKYLYNIEKNKLLEKNKEYLDEMNKKIIEHDEDFIENRDLFSVLDYEPVLIRTGFDGNYLKYVSNGSNSLSFDEYLELIRPYLGDLINVYKTKGEWKLQLSAEISFVSQKPDSDEKRVMYTKSICEEFMIGSETEEITGKLIMSLLQKYQDNLQNKMRGSDFVFDAINCIYYDFNRITISKGGSYIESPKWLKDKKCTINQKNSDNMCFKYAATLALNLNKINKHPQRISRIKPFIDNYNWNSINFPSTGNDWNRFEVNNKNVALNILYIPYNTKKVEIA